MHQDPLETGAKRGERKAYAMIKKAFDENGVKFAFRPCRSPAKATLPRPPPLSGNARSN